MYYVALNYKLKQLVLMSLKCSPPIVYSPKIYADYVACFFEKEKGGDQYKVTALL
jgi:hypothetical protein